MSKAQHNQAAQTLKKTLGIAMAKFGLESISDLPQFEDLANEITNSLLDGLEGIELPEVIQQMKDRTAETLVYADDNTAKNVAQQRAASPVQQPPPPEEIGAEQAPQPDTSTQTSDLPQESTPPPEPPPPAPLPPIGSTAPPTARAGAKDPATGSHIAHDQSKNQQLRTPQAGTPLPPIKQRSGFTQSVNALRFRRPIKKLERERKVIVRKQKNLNKHYKKLKNKARPIQALHGLSKRTLQLIWILEILLYTIGVFLCMTIIGIKLGVPLIAFTNRVASFIKRPIKEEIKHLERRLKPINKRLKGSKKGLVILQKKLQTNIQKERAMRNRGLLSSQRSQGFNQPSAASA